MLNIARNDQQTPENTEETSVKKPWLRQEGESALWFNRFRRYMDLGPKRSLQAALAHEKEHISALKSPNKPTSQTGNPEKPRKTPNKKSAATLKAVPAAKPQVPGSWKQAAKIWRWVERAKAWDEHSIDFTVEENLQTFLTGNFTTTLGSQHFCPPFSPLRVGRGDSAPFSPR